MSKQSELNHAQIDYNLLSFIAHECRGPFNGLIGFSELLYTNNPQLSAEQHETYTELVHQLSVKSYLQVQTLIVWIKLLSNNLTIQTGIVNYNEYLQQTISTLRVDLISKNIDLSAPSSPLSIKGDQQLLSIALANILYSSFRFLDEKSSIQLDVHESDRSLSITLPHSADFELLLNNTLSNPTGQTEQNFRIWIALQIFHRSHIEINSAQSPNQKLTIITLKPSVLE